jgi:hypothetical protein
MTQVTIQTTPATNTNGPQPGTPEYTAQMVAAFDGQGPAPSEIPLDQAPNPGETPPSADGSTTPADGDKKPEGDAASQGDPEKKPEGDASPEGDKAPEGFAAFTDLAPHLNDDGTFKAESLEALTKLGVPAEVSEGLQGWLKELTELRGYKATQETAKLTASLEQAAGGKQEFTDLITWGKANLTAAEKEHLDVQLNGPFAAQAIELLKLKRGPAKPASDPTLHTPASAASASLGGYKSLAEQMTDFQNPKYQTDPAFRHQVAQRLRLTRL